MNKFIIPVSSGLIDIKHYNKMGSAIWLFMWFINKVTYIKDGWGKVLSGKPITYEEIYDSFKLPMRTIRRYTEILKCGGYIKTVRTPKGQQIWVANAFKPTLKSEKVKGQKWTIPDIGSGQKVYREWPNLVGGVAKSGQSNIRYNTDINTDIIHSSSKKEKKSGYYVENGVKRPVVFTKGKWMFSDVQPWTEFNYDTRLIIK